MISTISTDLFDLYGVRLSVQTDSASLRAVVDSLLGAFGPAGGDERPAFRCLLSTEAGSFGPELSLPPGLEPAYAERGTCYYRAGPRSYLTVEGGALGMADTEQRQIRLYVPADFLEDHAWCTEHNLLRFLILELLRTNGIFAMHAGAVALGQAGILIPASGGGGKSTFSIALTRAGCDFLVDDVLLLRRQGPLVEAMYLPDEVSLHPRSLDFFPELAPLRDSAPAGREKVSFRVPEVYPGRTAERCIPRMIVFPRVVHQPSSQLSPLTAMESWCRLLSQSLWAADAEAGRRHWELLEDLMEQCAAYELAIGTDVQAAAELVIAALKEEAN